MYVSGRQELRSAAPDGTTIWVLLGTIDISFGASSDAGAPASAAETFRVLVGPALAGGARAVGIVSASKVTILGPGTYSVRSVEAEIDDETSRVQLMFEVALDVPAANTTERRTIRVDSGAYQVTAHGQAAT